MLTGMRLHSPKCQSQEIRKAGTSRHGHQRWMCKECGRTFGEKNHRVIYEGRRQQALTLYAEGMSARAFEREVGVSHNSVLGWVRQEAAGQALVPVPAQAQQIVEMDEMWSYCGSKMWWAIERSTHRIVAWALGGKRHGDSPGAAAAAGRGVPCAVLHGSPQALSRHC